MAEARHQGPDFRCIPVLALEQATLLQEVLDLVEHTLDARVASGAIRGRNLASRGLMATPTHLVSDLPHGLGVVELLRKQMLAPMAVVAAAVGEE